MRDQRMTEKDAVCSETVNIERNYRPVAIRAVLAAYSVKPQVVGEYDGSPRREPELVARLLSE